MESQRLGLPETEMDEADAARVARLARRLNTANYAGRIALAGASGCWVRGGGNREYLDLLAGYGVASTGWNHPRLAACMQRYASRGLFAPPMLATPEAAALSHGLLEVMAMPEGWCCVRATGGADANEQVLKAIGAVAARKGRTGPVLIARFERAYHGGTTATLGLSDAARFGLHRPLGHGGGENPMLPLPSSAADVRDAAALFESDQRIAAVFVEPVIGSGGVHAFPPEYLRGLREECTKRDVLLVMDEVITGCGRVGAMLQSHRCRVMPDAVTLGKGLSAGAAAIGAALLSPELAEAMRGAEDTSSTFAWPPVACAVAVENLSILEDESLCSKAAINGDWFASQLVQIFSGAFGERASVRSCGMMFGITVRDADGVHADRRAVQRLVLRCEGAGLLVGASWDWESLVLLPPLTISREELVEAIVRLGRALEPHSTTPGRAFASPRR